MQFESVKHIAQYYKAIPGMLRLLQQEREELEGNCLLYTSPSPRDRG